MLGDGTPIGRGICSTSASASGLQERQRVMIAEPNSRVKNTLARRAGRVALQLNGTAVKDPKEYTCRLRRAHQRAGGL